MASRRKIGGSVSDRDHYDNVMTCINFEDSWIINSGCSHLMSNACKFSSLKSYGGKNVIITVDNIIHPLEKKGSVTFFYF